MLRGFLFALCAVFLAILPAGPVEAYENEHYVWTYYLALQVGFNERQAYQIASGTIEVDFDAETNPMPLGVRDKGHTVFANADDKRFRERWRRFHAFMSMDAFFVARDRGEDPYEMQEPLRLMHQERLWNLATQQRNPGAFLHFLQDREPHGGWGDYVGHGPGGHVPDYFRNSRRKALKMTEDTLLYLQAFKSEMCKGRPVQDHPHCQYRSPNMQRITEVLDRMIAATDIPPPVQGIKESDELMDRIKVRSLEVRDIPDTIQAWNLVINLLLAEIEYASDLIPAGLPRNLMMASQGNVDQPLEPYMNVVRQAIREDRSSGVLPFVDKRTPNRDAFVDAVNRASWSRFPSDWIDLDFDVDGKLHILPPAIYQIEEQRLEGGLSQAGEPEYRSVSGSGADELFEISLKIPMKLSGRNDMSSFIRSGSGRNDFHTGLPVAVHSQAGGGAGPQGPDEAIVFLRDANSVDNPPPAPGGASNIELVDNASAIRIAIKRKRADLEKGDIEWNLALSPYGYPLQERSFTLRVDPEARPDDDPGGDAGDDDSRCEQAGAAGPDCAGTAGDTAGSAALDGALEEMRALEAEIISLGANAQSTAQAADQTAVDIERQLAEVEALLRSLAQQRNAEAAGGAGESAAIARLNDEASRIAQRMIDIRNQIEGHTLGICKAYENMKAASDLQSVEEVHASLGSAQAIVDGLAGEYRAARQRLEQLRAEAQGRFSSASASTSGSNGGASPDAQLAALEGQISILRNRQGALAGAEARAGAIIERSRQIMAGLRSLDTSTLGSEDQARLTEIYAIGSRLPASRSPLAGYHDRIAGLAEAMVARLAAARSLAASLPASQANALAADASAERLKREIAFKKFNASYETAMLFADSIEDAQRSSHICNNAAQAMRNHRREMDRLARGEAAPPAGGPQGGSPSEPVEPIPDPILAEPERVAPAEPGPVPGGAESPWPAPGASQVSADPCSSPAVADAFARADQAIVARDHAAWSGAIGFISGQGCSNGRLQASIAAGGAVWKTPRDAGEDRPRDEQRPRKQRKGPSFGEVLGGLIGAATAIDNARRGGGSAGPASGSSLGGLETVLGGIGRTQGGSNGGEDHPHPPAAAAGGSQPGTSSTNQNWCNVQTWEVHRIENQVLQASQAGDEERAVALHRKAADMIIEACRRGCPNVDKGFCDGSRKNEGWP